MRIAAAGLALAAALALPGQERQKAAAGEHMTVERFGGGDNTDVIETRELWTLWRLATGGYQVEGKRHVRWIRENLPREYDFAIELSPELHPVRAPRLDWLREMTSCEFGLKEFSCRAGDERVQAAITAPYDLFDASPWFLGSAVRRATREVDHVTPLRMVLIDEPFGVGSFRSWVRYLGEEDSTHWFKLDIGAQQWKRIRVSPEGIVLSIEDLRTKARTELIKLEKFAGFGQQTAIP
jgi:hypothetical protein